MQRSEEHTSELQSQSNHVCSLLLDTSTPKLYTLSLHDALPISMLRGASIHLRVEEDAPLWFQLDGELRQAADGAAGVRVSIAPAKLNVLRSPAREPVTNG